MDLKSNLSAVKMIYDCMIRERTDFEATPFYPQKDAPPVMTEAPPAFQTAFPSEVGMDTERVLRFAERVGADRAAGVHSVLLLVGGRQIFAASAKGYSTRLPHMTFSMCKTVTGLAVGMLVDEGRLRPSDRVADFFPEYAKRRSLSALTVQDLLTMSSGIPFTETGAVLKKDWTRACLESSLLSAPGADFSYNSMNTYLLAAILCRITGESLTEYLTPRLWEPLGVESAFWEKSPEGIEKGGWGLYLSPESMAKLGLLFLGGGTYRGRRIISREWIERSVRTSMAVPTREGGFDYGYQLWVHRKGEGYLFNGMLGQNVWVLPERELVLVITAGDAHMLQDTSALRAGMECFGSKTPLSSPRRATRGERLALFATARDFGMRSAWLPPQPLADAPHLQDELLAAHLFLPLHPPANNAGLLTLLHRLIQNNHSPGISAIALSVKEGVLTAAFTEGEVCYEVRAGNCTYLPAVLSVKGEHYRVAAAYAFCKDEDGLPICKLEIKFTELAYTRRMIFRLTAAGELALRLYELPGLPELESVAGIATAGEGVSFLSLLKETAAARRLIGKMRRSFDQTLSLSYRTDETADEEELSL